MNLLRLYAIAPTLLSVGMLTKSVTRLLRHRDGSVKMKNEEGIRSLYIDFALCLFSFLNLDHWKLKCQKMKNFN